jgi:hypothetical protein
MKTVTLFASTVNLVVVVHMVDSVRAEPRILCGGEGSGANVARL